MKEYRVIYDTEHFIDGFEVATEDEAIERCKDIYLGWMAAEDKTQTETWDNMIYTCSAWVEKFDPEEGGYIPYWEPDDEYLTSIGWDTIEEE